MKGFVVALSVVALGALQFASARAAEGGELVSATYSSRRAQAATFFSTPPALPDSRLSREEIRVNERPMMVTRGVRREEPASTLTNYTLYRFDPRFGDIAVQPVLGRINGAQLFVTF